MRRVSYPTGFVRYCGMCPGFTATRYYRDWTWPERTGAILHQTRFA